MAVCNVNGNVSMDIVVRSVLVNMTLFTEIRHIRFSSVCELMCRESVGVFYYYYFDLVMLFLHAANLHWAFLLPKQIMQMYGCYLHALEKISCRLFRLM